jgi:pantetheine-phosphate adenylyltransferase
MKIAIYAGSFDPITLGHLDVIDRSVALFDKVIVAIGHHPAKNPLLSRDERMQLLLEVTRDRTRVEVAAFDGLLVTYALSVNASVIVRGLRAAMDFEYELQTAHANADICPAVDTMFLPTRVEKGFLSSSLVREIASHGGDVSRYVPPVVARALAAKYGGKK